MKLLAIDGNSILNRSYYGINRPMMTREGLYTHAVFGFLTTLLRIRQEETPDAVCVTFDVHAPTFRHQKDETYKGTRKPMPEELRVQMPVVKEALDALRIPRYELAGWEADDLLGTISRKCEQAGWECVIVTGDKDSLQLITDRTRVKLVSTRIGKTTTQDMTPETFREAYGFDPIRMIDLKALMGDASDNIPGVPGVGEKTALSLLRSAGSLDAVYRDLPHLDAKPNVLKKLEAGRDSAYHSFWLATIVTDAPLDFTPEENLCREPGPEAYPLFLKLEFSRLMERFGLTPPPEPSPADADAPVFTGTCTTVELTDRQAAEAAAASLRESGETAYVRTSGNLDLAVLHASAGEDATAYILDEARFDGDYNAALQLFFDGSVPLAGHHIKDVQRALLARECGTAGWVFDSALAAYLLDATAGSYHLDRLSVRYTGSQIGRASDRLAESAGEGQPSPGEEQLSLLDGAETPPSDASAENADSANANADAGADANANTGTDADADAEARRERAARYGDLAAEAAAIEALREVMEPQLKERRAWDLYQTAELPLCRVLAEMEETGCLVDPAALSDFGTMLTRRMEEQERRVYDAVGERFNINSPKQLGEILFGKLRLPHGKKTKTGWSTSAEVLENLREESPVVDSVLEYRQYAKLKSTYADGLLKAIASDGRIHTSFQMTVTATGRLSSAEPNLQNIPTRTDLGSEIRKMFLPAPGCVLVDADYSQIELRLLAHISGDEAMRDAFARGLDIHTATAARVFRVSEGDVTPEMRRGAKAVNFGLVYGISPFSLSRDIGVTVQEAKGFMETYFTAFPGVRRYMDAIVERAKQDGYVETLFHRRRDLPELKSSKFATRAFGERVALNMPIQGTAADVMKLAMVRVWERLRRELPEARLVLQVHDELIVECPEASAEQAASCLREEMEGVAALSVPLIAEAHWGRNWLEAKG